MKQLLLVLLCVLINVGMLLAGCGQPTPPPEAVSLADIYIGKVSGTSENPRFVEVEGELIFPSPLTFRPPSLYGLWLSTGSARENVTVKVWVAGKSDEHYEETALGKIAISAIVGSSGEAKEGDWVRVTGALKDGELSADSLTYLAEESPEEATVAEIAAGVVRGKPDKAELVKVRGNIKLSVLSLEQRMLECKFRLSWENQDIVVWIGEGTSPNQVEIEGTIFLFSKLTMRDERGAIVEAGDTVGITGWLSPEGELRALTIESVR